MAETDRDEKFSQKNEHYDESTPSTRGMSSTRSISTLKTSSIQIKTRSLTITMAIALLLPVSIGGTTVALLAYSFHIAGVALGSFLMFTAILLNVYTCYLILQTANLVIADSFHMLAKKTYGRCAEAPVAILNCLCLMASAVSATVFNKNVAKALVLHLWDKPNEILMKESFWVLFFILGGVIPFLTCPRISGMRILAYITTGLILIFTLLAIIGLFVQGNPKASQIEWFKPQATQILIAMTIYNYPLMIQICILPVFKELKNYTIKRGTKVVFLDSLFIIILFFVIALFGYLTFINGRIEELEQGKNIFRTERYSQWIPIKLVSFTLIFTTLTSIIALLMPVKQIVFQFFQRTCKLSSARYHLHIHFFSAIIVSTIVSIFAMIADDIVVVMRFNGVTLYPLLSYTFPALFYLKVAKRRTVKVVINSVLSGLLICLTVLLCTKGIYDLIK